MTHRYHHRHYSPLDRLIIGADQALKSLAGGVSGARRTNPADAQANLEADLNDAERAHAAGLMRVNHAGEVCAQALYQSQALTARSDAIRNAMEQAAREEIDHLHWCEQRLEELNSHGSRLNPFWYAGSFLIGGLAGLAGDRWNLGFVAETERQVVRHLESHLHELPAQDARSRAIVAQMKLDEAEHATLAVASGAAELPAPVKQSMQLASKLMTTLAYRF